MLPNLLDTKGFPPRWCCGTAWTDVLGWTHIISDIAIFLAYFSIPIALGVFILRNREIPFFGILYLFIAFIALCGIGHLIEAIIFWHPVYKLAGLVKLLTAIVSVATAIVLIFLLPKIINVMQLFTMKSRFLNVIEASKDMIISFDKNGDVISVLKLSDEIEKKFMLNSGASIFDDAHILFPEKFTKNHLNHLFQKRAEPFTYSIKVQAENKDFYYEGVLTPIKSHNQEVIEVMMILKDKTSDIQMKKQLSDAYGDLKDFTYTASHDLKEPLRSISNLATVIQLDYAKKLDQEALSMLEKITKASGKLNNLLDVLLQFSRLGNENVERKNVESVDIVRSVQESLAFLIKEKNAQINCVTKMPKIYCNEALIAEVFQNLFINAIKYNTNEKKIIEVGVLDDKSSTEVTFYVKDNGIGIDEMFHESIFRIFKRLHGKGEFADGTGSGLAIAQKIITRNNGHIWVESEPGKGSVFYFTVSRERVNAGS